jgi:hypothetical protein
VPKVDHDGRRAVAAQHARGIGQAVGPDFRRLRVIDRQTQRAAVVEKMQRAFSRFRKTP